ncbi:MAG: BamA/TamA family outer membrane protein [Bacteroidales bacterium]|nr:BamA/TamA family outer membrane protein [Bacteroidales bacterium]
MPFILLFLALINTPFAYGIGEVQFSENDSIRISEIAISGNRRTQNQIILRELEFNVGDSFLASDIEIILKKSRENLINTSLFNFIDIVKDVDTSSLMLKIQVNLIERWYILPYFAIKSAEENINSWWGQKNIEHLSLAMTVVDNNFRGMREELILKTNIGYDRSLGLTYSIPYVNKQKTLGVMINTEYGAYKEMILGIEDYAYCFFRSPENLVLTKYSAGAGILWRPLFRTTQQLNLEYHNASFLDEVLDLNPNLVSTRKISYLRIYSKLKIDHRNNKAYPTEGSYVDLIITQTGLGLLSGEKNMQSSFETNVRFYQAISKRLFWASGMHGVIAKNASKTEYFGQEIGNYNNEMRAFENYRIPFTEAFISKNNFKIQVIPKKVKKIPFLKTETFSLIHYAVYLNAFFDLAYVKPDWQRNPLLNRRALKSNFFYSSGVGLDVVTYYDMVFRFECSRNFEFNSWGFFVHLRTSI